MIRCPDCNATLDSMSELATHECEPTYPTPQEAKRIRKAVTRQNDAERNASAVRQAWEEYGGA